MSKAALQVKTEILPNSRIAVTLEIPAARCKASYDEALSRLSRSIKLPGFRKGKVPKTVLVQQLGATQINATALEKLLDGAWKEAISSESIEPLCEPEIRGGFDSLFASFQPTQDLNVTLETDISPSPTLKETKGLETTFEKIKFDPIKVDELIEQSRKQLATLIPVEKRAAKIGDVAVVSFKGIYQDDNQEIEGGSAESMDIELEEGKMIPGFIEGIIGMKLTEGKSFNCTFPKDYPQEEARGRTAVFEVKLEELKTRELPKLDDDFAKQASDKSSMKELREDLEKRLKDDSDRKNSNNQDEALIQLLINQIEVELPKTMIDEEVKNIVEQTARQFAQQGMDVKKMFTAELIQSLMESSKEDAKKNLLRSLSLQALAKQEKISIGNEELEVRLEEVNKELAGEKNIDQVKLRNAVSDDLLQVKLLKWMRENNTLIEQTNKPSKKSASKKSAKT